MILLDDDFLKNELDYRTIAKNTAVYYKEIWYLVAGFVCRPVNNRLGISFENVEEFVTTGEIKRKAGYKSPIKDNDERITIFKRAMGLQLIYDEANGKNIMQRGTQEDEDICRECYVLLKSIGLIQPIGWELWVFG